MSSGSAGVSTLAAGLLDYVAESGGGTWHVAPGGSDSAAGSAVAPFASLDKALSVVNPGDTVLLQDGEYHESVVMTRSGAAGRYVTVRAVNAGAARLIGPAGSYSALVLKGVGWVRVQGLDVRAADGHGIEAENSHHIQLVGNRCHDCGGSGISLEAGDYYLVEANEIFRNASTNPFQTSGISIYQARAYDAATGFHIVVRRNACWGNIESSTGLAQTSEGNGIILDDFQNAQVSAGSTVAGNYAHRSLVENNLAFGNGGGGIVVFQSDHVTVRHNTAALNNTDTLNPGTWRGELSNSQGRDNQWYNNIAVCSTALSPQANALLEVVNDGFANTGSVWSNNLLFDLAAPQRDALLVQGSGNVYSAAVALANNRFRADPLLAGSPALNSADALRLRSGSPALNAALVAQASPVDFDNRARGALPDIGAFESA